MILARLLQAVSEIAPARSKKLVGYLHTMSRSLQDKLSFRSPDLGNHQGANLLRLTSAESAILPAVESNILKNCQLWNACFHDQ